MFARIFALQLVARLLHLVHNGRLYANATAIVSTTGPFDDSGTAAFAGSTAFDTRICLECMSEDYTGLACDVSELCGEAPDGSAGVCDMLGIGYDQWLGAGASDELANDDDDDRQDYGMQEILFRRFSLTTVFIIQPGFANANTIRTAPPAW